VPQQSARALKHQSLVEPWHGRRIMTGAEFDDELSDKLESVDIIRLLMSYDS
jgi:hypothetical protein